MCGQPPDFRGLHPHEDPLRSQGGKLSMKSSMLCGKCHGGESGHRTEGIEHGKPVQRKTELSGFHGLRAYPKKMQTGIKKLRKGSTYK